MKVAGAEIQYQCRIHAAVGDDASALSLLAMRSKAHWGYDENFMNSCRGELTYSAEQILAPGYDFQVCEHRHELVGFYALERVEDELIELEALFVEPRYIGTGIGRLMIESAKNRAASSGARRMIIQGDPHTGSFYLAVGALMCGSRESGSIPNRHLPLYELVLDRLTADTDTGK